MKNSNSVYATVLRLLEGSDVVILGETEWSSLCFPELIKRVNEISSSQSNWLLMKDKALEDSRMTMLCRTNLCADDMRVLRSDDDSKDGNRVAVKMLLTDGTGLDDIVLYVLHWSSMVYGGHMFKKESYAMTLFNDMRVDDCPRAVCIGDFNAEPYHKPFAWLKASRSRRFAVERGMFYNPFWKFLNEENGTIAFPSNYELLCPRPLIDQAIVSSKVCDDFSIIESELLSDFYTPMKSEHVPIRLKLGR